MTNAAKVSETAQPCLHIKALATPREIPNVKGRFQFFDWGYITNIQEGTSLFKPVLRAMKEMPSGRFTFTAHWMEVKYCPLCGAKVQEE